MTGASSKWVHVGPPIKFPATILEYLIFLDTVFWCYQQVFAEHQEADGKALEEPEASGYMRSFCLIKLRAD